MEDVLKKPIEEVKEELDMGGSNPIYN